MGNAGLARLGNPRDVLTQLHPDFRETSQYKGLVSLRNAIPCSQTDA